MADIKVTGNHYFSSNNVMRALPSLHTNMVLNGPIFKAELNRANANQDRQIYPVIGPGPEPGTSELTLKVKDHLPLHAKLEFNNENSPGTPDLRVNSSAVATTISGNWTNPLGVQYGFSPEDYKAGRPMELLRPADRWPITAPSTACRWAVPKPIGETIANNPGVLVTMKPRVNSTCRRLPASRN